MAIRIATMHDVRVAESVVHKHVSPAPLIRSYPLEKELGLPVSRRVWLKDYGWTPVGSFKLLGALNWLSKNLDRIGNSPIVAHSSGNFASGISFAGMRFEKRVLIVMPNTAARVKFRLTRSFGADIRTYDISVDHETGERERLTRQIAATKEQSKLRRTTTLMSSPETAWGVLRSPTRGLSRGVSHFFAREFETAEICPTWADQRE